MTQSDDANNKAEQAVEETTPRTDRPLKKLSWHRSLLISLTIIVAAVLLSGSYIGYLYASTPLSVREPLFEHYHFRMSLNINGEEEDFGQVKYQEGYAKDNCNAKLTTHPIHFHDDKNHFVHIHWEGMTGGQVLKYYGWNFIGGTRGSLGYRFDDLPRPQRVAIHGNALPAIPDNANYFIYTGDSGGYNQRKWEEFTQQDLEKFFGKESNSPAHKLNQEKRSSWLDRLTPKAYAHGTAEEHAAEVNGGPTVEELTQINNLIGNTVIFVQQQEPSADQIKERFNNLTAMGTSSCGG